MNFRTTVILFLLVLGLALGALWATRDRAPTTPATDEAAGGNGVSRERLIHLAEADITRLELTTSDGARLVADRHAGGWRVSAPVSAPADRAAVEGLLGSLVVLRSGGHVNLDGDPGKLTALGLNPPANVIVLHARSQEKPVRLAVGARTGTGGDVYVRLDDRPHADFVPALLLSDLEKPLAHFRESQLLPELRSPEVSAITLRDPEAADDQTIELVRHGDDWRMNRPEQFSVERSATTDLLFALTGLRASEFVSEDAATDAAKYGLDRPQWVVEVRTAPVDATTQPTTQPGTTHVVRFGRYDDLLKRDVFVTVGDGGAVARVPARSLDALRREPHALRDRRVLQVDPAVVRRMTITREPSPTSQPAAAPPAPVVFERRVEDQTEPPATTQADPPAARWVAASDGARAVDSAEVDAVLGLFNPLRVDRYLPTLNFVAAPGAVVVTLESVSGEKHELRLFEPASTGSATGTGSVGSTAFELPADVFQRVRELAGGE